MTHETSLRLSLKGTDSSPQSWAVKPRCEARKIEIVVPSGCLHTLENETHQIMQFRPILWLLGGMNVDVHPALTYVHVTPWFHPFSEWIAAFFATMTSISIDGG